MYVYLLTLKDGPSTKKRIPPTYALNINLDNKVGLHGYDLTLDRGVNHRCTPLLSGLVHPSSTPACETSSVSATQVLQLQETAMTLRRTLKDTDFNTQETA
ncbi:MAG: hypothetical protein AAF485_33125, partial [Chloroflexota bacterium]